MLQSNLPKVTFTRRAARFALRPLLKSLPALLLFSAQAAWAAPFAYIPNGGSGNVSVIDLATDTAVGTPIAVQTTPTGIAFDLTGSRAYVSNFGSNSVSVIDTASNSVIATVAVGTQPQGMALNPAGTRLYVANFNGNSVSVIDTATNTVVDTLTNGTGSPRGVSISPDGSRLYVANRNVSTVSVIDIATGNVLNTVALGNFPFGILLNAAGTRLYIASTLGNFVKVIDTTTNPPSVIADIAFTQAQLLALNAASSRLYVSGASNNVLVIDTSTNTVVSTVATGATTLGIAVNPADGLVRVVTGTNPGRLLRIDPTSNTLLAGFATVGNNPQAYGSFITNGPNTNAQTISFPAPPTVLAPGESALLSATASSGLGVSVSSQTPDVCTLSGLEVKVLSLGLCTLLAEQPGSFTFSPASVLLSFGTGSRTADVRTYVPLSDAGSGYVSAVRVINPSPRPTTVAVGVIDDATGTVSTLRNLPVIVPPGGAVTFDSVQIEATLALTAALPASKRPRLRVVATEAVPIEVQSYLRNPSGVFNEVSGAQTGAAGVAINVRTFVPSSSPAYVSTLRFINTGAVATAVSVARMDPVTGAVGAPATLIASLPAGAAVSLGAGQIEAALGRALAPADRPRLQVTAASSALEVQTYLSQPAGGFAEVSAAQTGTSVMVRSFYPSNTPNRTSFVRIINAGVAGTTPVFATLIDNATGQTLANGVLASSLLAGAVVTYTSSQIEAALNYTVTAGITARLRVASNGMPLEVQSFLAQPNGWFTNTSNAQVGTNPVVKLHVPQIDASTGYASVLRITNTGAVAAEVRASLIDDFTGSTTGQSQVLIASLAAGATQTLNAAQVEAVFGIGLGSASLGRINPGSRPRLRLSSTQMLEVQSLLTNPAGVMTDISSGQ